MRILVTGGLAFHDKATVYGALDKTHKKRGIDAIIQHAAGGVNYLATEWAFDNGVGVCTYNDKPTHVREDRMIRDGKPDAAIIFGGSPMAEKLKAAGIPVWEIKTSSAP